MTNSTVSGNQAQPWVGSCENPPRAVGAGGIDISHGDLSAPSSSIKQSTIFGNSPEGLKATTAGQPFGVPVIFAGTLLAGNAPNCVANITSQGFNLDDGTSCGLAATGDRSGVNPLLGPLADNGGLTQTHGLLPGSPARDGGVNATCPSTDQRRVERPRDGDGNGSFVCDIGAFEADGPLGPTPTPIATITPTPTASPIPTTSTCAPRPPVQSAVTRGAPGSLNVTVTAGVGALDRLVFHGAPASAVPNPNVLVDIGGIAGRSGEFTFTPPPGSTTVTFSLRRGVASGAATIPIDVFDGCGAWSTFIGGGPDAWGVAPNALTLSTPTPTPTPPAGVRDSTPRRGKQRRHKRHA